VSTPTVPQQSDYLTAWESHQQNEPKVDGKIKSRLRTLLSPSSIATISMHLNRLRVRRSIRRWKRGAVPSNRRFYKPVKDWDVSTRDVTGSARQG
jgi:hypothetical protein